MTERQPLNILLVEDNPGDVDLTVKALDGSKFRNKIAVAADGEIAMAMLRHEGEHARAARPDLVLLDLNIPKMDGLEVLAAIKADSALRQIPVVVLTSSSAQRDVAESYKLHANCFVTKPVDLHEFLSVVQSIEQFWLEIVRLPT